MRRLLQGPCIAAALCAALRLHAMDYVISGEETLYNVDGARTSAVMFVTFTLRQEGTNWAISAIYTNSGAVDTIATAGRCAFAVTRDLYGRGPGAGYVTENEMAAFEGLPVFSRVLQMAFLTPRQSLATVTNAPVPFLDPCHAALHCYRWDLRWSPKPPYLPEYTRFDLDPALVRQVPAEVVSYYFRSGFQDRSLFKAFAASQRGGAEYAVTAWTNWSGEALPLRSTFKFTRYETVNKLVVPQLLVVTVTNIAAPGSEPMIPALNTGDGVQHIISGTCYYYTSAGGEFLSPEQANKPRQSDEC